MSSISQKGAGDMAERSEGKDETAAQRAGVIAMNDLVYRLEADLSVAINRTHKAGFFQNNTYSNSQTSIAIFNSGADYIDARRSFLSLTVEFPETPALAVPFNNGFISGYFGENGSILNLIDSVIVYTRSGDELSRIPDYGTLMYHLIPWMFGSDWKKTIAEEIGFGGYLAGHSSDFPLSIENYQTRYNIPLYLLSPIFTYGRLLPSMLMSGLRVEIKWKPLDQAVQQYWERLFRYSPPPNSNQWPVFTGSDDSKNNRTNQQMPWPIVDSLTQDDVLINVLDSAMSGSSTWQLTVSSPAGVNVLEFGAPHTPLTDPMYPNETRGGFYPQRPTWIPGIDEVGISHPSVSGGLVFWFPVIELSSANAIQFAGAYPHATILFVNTFLIFRRSRLPFPNIPARGFSEPVRRGTAPYGITLPPASSAFTSYTISNPQFALCSIQLADAVQRHLNEYSATNGLEVVYADWDRTSTPLGAGGSVVPVYSEVRKSASRALQVFAVVTDSSSPSVTKNSFRSVPEGYWNHYQLQLGSLYFPQQRVDVAQNANLDLHKSAMEGLMYNYALDAFDRFHPKAAPTMMRLNKRRSFPWQESKTSMTTTISRDGSRDPYIIPFSVTGQRGSFAAGGQVVSTCLERSTMFDLSGIPINNSRVLALRGEYNLTLSPFSVTSTTLFLFLKYVRIARVFLINCEVEQ